MQKAIEPVSIWANGTSQNANVFSLISISDNLQNSATFYYQLLMVSEAPEPAPTEGETAPAPMATAGQSQSLAEGNLTLGPTEYPEWDGSNAWILDWAAAQLNLTFLPGAEIV